MNHLLQAPDEVDVSGQVRAGQLGLLVAAKIAQTHGLSVLLQENVTGGTALVVVRPAPGRDYSVDETQAHRPTIGPASPSTQPAVTTAGQVSHPVIGLPAAGESQRSSCARFPGVHV
ncbi:hypothetical protein SMICM17S_01634 [Streptomyces microflavus]